MNSNNQRELASVAAGLSLTAILATATGVAQTDVVTFHDFSALPSSPLGQMQVKAVVTESESIVVAEFPPGVRQPPLYHEQEQFVIGLGGSMEFRNGGIAHRVDRHVAVVTASNAEHYFVNGNVGVGTIVEFQPVRRPDWLPPHPRMPLSKSPEPVPVSPDQMVTADFAVSSAGWRVESNGARVKVLDGRTIRLTVWDLPSPTANVELSGRINRPELFAYLLDGGGEVTIGSNRREIKSNTLFVVSPAARDVRMRSLDSGHAVVAVFEALTR
jgi:quercetin dioxygenase-like cupin family protein